jgi:hypothetical protein
MNFSIRLDEFRRLMNLQKIYGFNEPCSVLHEFRA